VKGKAKYRKQRRQNDRAQQKKEQEELPPTPGLNKLGPAAQEAARSRAKAFYPFT